MSKTYFVSYLNLTWTTHPDYPKTIIYTGNIHSTADLIFLYKSIMIEDKEVKKIEDIYIKTINVI